jgi:hypothetical protein
MTASRTTSGPMFTRIRSEFLEMPGLRLTGEQVQRLCGVERIACQAVLDQLVETNVLYRSAVGVYSVQRT